MGNCIDNFFKTVRITRSEEGLIEVSNDFMIKILCERKWGLIMRNVLGTPNQHSVGVSKPNKKLTYVLNKTHQYIDPFKLK